MDDDTGLLDLLRFAAASRTTGGFGALDRAGSLEPDSPIPLWVTCRMTHVFGLATLLEPAATDASSLLDHGVDALLGTFRDHDAGGWYTSLDGDGSTPADSHKEAYVHCFVVLAGATASVAGHPRGRALLEESLSVLADRFWDDDAGMLVDSWDPTFENLDDYRGLNANMHGVEALLAAHDVTGDAWPLAAATRIAARVCDDLGPGFDWRLPEHFDAAWTPVPDFNREVARDPFRPYGVTIGHLLEWARLLLHLDLAHDGHSGLDLRGAASALTATAVRDGWHVDGADGFVYTVDFDGVPVVRERMHWVAAEAIANAWMRVATGLDDDALTDHQRWLGFAHTHHVDPVGGSWWHELDAQLRPSFLLWPGKPDAYHVAQALWLPRLAPSGTRCVSFAGAARRAADAAADPSGTP